jgi:hypothetical protein
VSLECGSKRNDITLWNVSSYPPLRVTSSFLALYTDGLTFLLQNSLSNMSLPDAIRDTTEHPSKNAVSAPVDRQEKAADVDRKVLPRPYTSTLTDVILSSLAPLLRCHRGFPPGAISFKPADRRCPPICPCQLSRRQGPTLSGGPFAHSRLSRHY